MRCKVAFKSQMSAHGQKNQIQATNWSQSKYSPNINANCLCCLTLFYMNRWFSYRAFLILMLIAHGACFKTDLACCVLLESRFIVFPPANMVLLGRLCWMILESQAVFPCLHCQTDIKILLSQTFLYLFSDLSTPFLFFFFNLSWHLLHRNIFVGHDSFARFGTHDPG